MAAWSPGTRHTAPIINERIGNNARPAPISLSERRSTDELSSVDFVFQSVAYDSYLDLIGLLNREIASQLQTRGATESLRKEIGTAIWSELHNNSPNEDADVLHLPDRTFTVAGIKVKTADMSVSYDVTVNS